MNLISPTKIDNIESEIESNMLLNSKIRTRLSMLLQNGQLVLDHQVGPFDTQSIIAGSFDPCTYGHVFLITKSLEINPKASICIIKSTFKDEDYQVFNVIERAALMVSYDAIWKKIRLGYNKIILCDSGEYQSANLKRIHQSANTIFKGVRGSGDIQHNQELVDKYQIPNTSIQEIKAPDGMKNISSGLLKREIFGGLIPNRNHCNKTVLNITQRAISQRTEQQNKAFLNDYL